MLEKPNLADEVIVARLQSAYGCALRALTFLPVGNDSRAWSYRVETVTGEYFLKLRKGRAKQASLIVPHLLHGLGIENVVAPLRTTSGQLFAGMDDFTLALYPYVHGESAWDMSLPLEQWRAWGDIMRSIHDATISSQLAKDVPCEVFAVKSLDTLARVEDVLARGAYSGDVAEAVALIWREKADAIELARSRYISLGEQLAARSPEFVLCHADIHTANIIIDAHDKIRIVDWDETLLAPKERDLMFFIDDRRRPETTQAFFDGYGAGPVDLLGLAYYKYDWVLQEFGDYGERVFLTADHGTQDLALAMREFKRLFAPGDVVERAHRAFARFRANHA